MNEIFSENAKKREYRKPAQPKRLLFYFIFYFSLERKEEKKEKKGVKERKKEEEKEGERMGILLYSKNGY